jgi:hypothetical protein
MVSSSVFFFSRSCIREFVDRRLLIRHRNSIEGVVSVHGHVPGHNFIENHEQASICDCFVGSKRSSSAQTSAKIRKSKKSKFFEITDEITLQANSSAPLESQKSESRNKKPFKLRSKSVVELGRFAKGAGGRSRN